MTASSHLALISGLQAVLGPIVLQLSGLRSSLSVITGLATATGGWALIRMSTCTLSPLSSQSGLALSQELLWSVALLSLLVTSAGAISGLLLRVTTLSPNFWLLLLSCFLLLAWSASDLLTFYVAFEAVLLPLVLILGIWGSGIPRLRASFLFFNYTLAGSLGILVGTLALWAATGSTNLQSIGLLLPMLPDTTEQWLWWSVFVAVAVKTPLYPFHTWLYRAHAEAPLIGSVVLAGIVLKIATFAFSQILLLSLPALTALNAPLLFGIGVQTLLLSSLSVIRATDIKAVIALSSVGHIALSTLGLASLNPHGFNGAWLLAFAHGVISPALFIYVGGVLYHRTHTRSVRYLRGLALTLPLGSSLWLAASAANIGVPPFGNWTAEFLILLGLAASPLCTFLAASTILFSAAISILYFTRMSIGLWSSFLSRPLTDLLSLESSLLQTLVVSGLALGVFCRGTLSLWEGYLSHLVPFI